MKNFVVFINPEFPYPQSIFDLLSNLRDTYGICFWGTKEQSGILPEFIDCLLDQSGSLPAIDCILVFGGDGTILRAKDIALRTGAPILGVNLGYLGFLSETTLKELQASLQNLINRKYKLLSRMMLSCQLKRDGKVIHTALALNDAVIYKAETPRLIRVRIYNGERFVFETRCDGVIAASPTGSTAYSLSAGGPLLSPEMQAIVISPLNPHILSIRPMVFPAGDRILMRVNGVKEPAWLQIDGVNCIQILDNDEVIVSAAKRTVKFIKLSNRTFYRILRNKLHLGK